MILIEYKTIEIP